MRLPIRKLSQLIRFYWRASPAVREAVFGVLFCLHDQKFSADGWKFTLYFSDQGYEGAVGGPCDKGDALDGSGSGNTTVGTTDTEVVWQT